jgi:hypothetical protein
LSSIDQSQPAIRYIFVPLGSDIKGQVKPKAVNSKINYEVLLLVVGFEFFELYINVPVLFQSKFNLVKS